MFVFRACRRRPANRNPRKFLRGPPDAAEIAVWRARLVEHRGCGPRTDPGYVRLLRRTGEWCDGIDMRTATDDEVVRVYMDHAGRSLAAKAREPGDETGDSPGDDGGGEILI